MRSGWLAMLASMLLSACDRPTPPRTNPPTSPPPAKSQTSLPPTGILRLSPANMPSGIESQFRATGGLPILCVRLEYAGPKTRLEVDTDGWHKGKKLGGSYRHYSIQLPHSGEAIFGFGEGTNSEGNVLATVIESIPTGSGRVGGKDQFAAPPIKDRDCHTFEPHWPLEVIDGKEAVFWGVFVEEPPGGGEAASLEERARRAESAWLFKIRTADERKEESPRGEGDTLNVPAHVHSADCGHYFLEGKWYFIAGHIHGPGCGHKLVEGKWTLVK